MKERKEREAEEEKRRIKEQLETAEKNKGNLEKKEAQLADDEASVDQLIIVTEKLLKEGQIRLTKATASKNMTEIELASSMIESANNKLGQIRQHGEQQQKVKADIGKKRGSLMDYLMASKKKKLTQLIYYKIIYLFLSSMKWIGWQSLEALHHTFFKITLMT